MAVISNWPAGRRSKWGRYRPAPPVTSSSCRGAEIKQIQQLFLSPSRFVRPSGPSRRPCQPFHSYARSLPSFVSSRHHLVVHLENCLLVDWLLTCSYGTIAPKDEMMFVCLWAALPLRWTSENGSPLTQGPVRKPRAICHLVALKTLDDPPSFVPGRRRKAGRTSVGGWKLRFRVFASRLLRLGVVALSSSGSAIHAGDGHRTATTAVKSNAAQKVDWGSVVKLIPMPTQMAPA